MTCHPELHNASLLDRHVLIKFWIRPYYMRSVAVTNDEITRWERRPPVIR